MALRVCSQCGARKLVGPESCFYLGQWFCSNRCRHDAGDRSGCYGWEKRRLLRDHRTNMRIMDDIIDEHGLSSELEERLVDETGNTNFFLGEDTDMDEDSDQEDPEAVAKQRANDLLQESKDKQAFVAAAQDTLAGRAVATDLERARMQLEDLRAHALR